MSGLAVVIDRTGGCNGGGEHLYIISFLACTYVYFNFNL